MADQNHIQDSNKKTCNTQQLNSNATSTSNTNAQEEKEKEKEEKANLLFEALTLGALLLDSELLDGREVTDDFWQTMVEVVTENQKVLEDEMDDRREDGDGKKVEGRTANNN